VKTLLIIFAVFVAVFGLGFFLVPAQVISIYGGDIQDEFAWRYFGASLLGIAVVNFIRRRRWQCRESRRGYTRSTFRDAASVCLVQRCG
jgi:hypothetical protein